MRFNSDGTSSALTADGVTRYSRAQTQEMHDLLGEVRRAGDGSPELCLEWLAAAGATPRALAPVLEERLRGVGVDPACEVCRSPHRDEIERARSVIVARNRYSCDISWGQLMDHKEHARLRRSRRPYRPREGSSAPAPWEQPDDLPKMQSADEVW